MENGRRADEPWPPLRLVCAVGWLAFSAAGTLLFFWQRPAAKAAVAERLGQDPMETLEALGLVLAIAWGLLALKLPPMAYAPPERRRWFIAAEWAVFFAIAVLGWRSFGVGD